MSLTALAWILGLLVLTIGAVARSSWAIGLYFYTFFMLPDFWWWGRSAGLHGYRWSLMSGVLSLILIWVHCRRRGRRFMRVDGAVDLLAIAILVNATLVHMFLAPNWAISLHAYQYVAKFVLLYFMIRDAIATRKDLWTVMLMLLLFAGYIGYEVTINDRGNIQRGRLEGVGAPGARGANQLACLMITILPLVSTNLIGPGWTRKALTVCLAPLVLNVVLEANSRGGFLAGIGSAIVFYLMSPRGARRYAAYGLCAGAMALWVLLGDPRIVERFMTTFVPSWERDRAAAERLILWRAGLAMVADHPFGSGGAGFKLVRGRAYMPDVGLQYNVRSVHNGYINEMCEWGIQGLLLKLGFLGLAAVGAWRTSRMLSARGETRDALVGAAIVAGMAGFGVAAVFGDYMDAEWGYWMAGFAVAYRRIFGGGERRATGRTIRHVAEVWRERAAPVAV